MNANIYEPPNPDPIAANINPLEDEMEAETDHSQYGRSPTPEIVWEVPIRHRSRRTGNPSATTAWGAGYIVAWTNLRSDARMIPDSTGHKEYVRRVFFVATAEQIEREPRAQGAVRVHLSSIRAGEPSKAATDIG